MVSGDSDKFVSGFLAIHRLSDLRNLTQPFSGQMTIIFDQLHASCEFLEVLLFRGVHWILAKKRDDHFHQVFPSSHDVTIQMFFVIVVPFVNQYLTNPKELTQLMQTRDTFRALGYNKLMSYLNAGSIAFTAFPIWLSVKADREASFSVYKTNNPTTFDQAFLLIVCTHRIFTFFQCSVGYSDFPAYGQMLTILLPIWGAAESLP
jgi:hypothetical protein